MASLPYPLRRSKAIKAMPGAKHLLGLAWVMGCLLAAPLSPAYAGRLDAFTARYDLQVGPLRVAQLEYALESQETGYHYRLVSQPQGLVALFSGKARNEEAWGLWRAENDCPQPQRYRRIDQPGAQAVVRTLAFDWPHKKLHIDNKDETSTVSLPDHALDPMSEQLCLMQQVAAGKKGVIEHVVANHKGVKHMRYEVQQLEEVPGPQGMVQAIRVARVDQDDKQLTLWFAPQLGHMLVRLEQKKKGKPTVTMTLQQLDKATQEGG